MNDTAETTTSTKPKRWYIVHAYSNFENKVADSIREQAKQRGLAEHIGEVLVPKEKVTEARRGRKVETERKFFPGYVLVKMDLTDEVYHLIKNTPKVTGFVGAGAKPTRHIGPPQAEQRSAGIVAGCSVGSAFRVKITPRATVISQRTASSKIPLLGLWKP